jgi:hypothetical protein
MGQDERRVAVLRRDEEAAATPRYTGEHRQFWQFR